MDYTAARSMLITFAVDAFNVQRHQHFKPQDFDIITIPHSGDYFCAFEIYTTMFSDFLVLHIYASLGNVNYIGEYTLNSHTDSHTGIESEVFAANATLDNEFLHAANNYIRRNCIRMDPNTALLNIILNEDDGAILDEDNEFIILEDSL